jgi:hypothetical protein
MQCLDHRWWRKLFKLGFEGIEFPLEGQVGSPDEGENLFKRHCSFSFVDTLRPRPSYEDRS